MEDVRAIIGVGAWRGYSGDHDVEAAKTHTPTVRELFEARYGRPPERVLLLNGLVYAGPLRPGEEMGVQ
jgi:hypothetical protein